MAGGMDRRSRKEFFHQQPPVPPAPSNNVVQTARHRTARPPKDARFIGRFTRTRRARVPHVVDAAAGGQAVTRRRRFPKPPPPSRGRMRRGVAARLNATVQAFVLFKHRAARQAKTPPPFRGRVLHGRSFRLNATVVAFLIFKRRYGRQGKTAPPARGRFGRGKGPRFTATAAIFLVVKRRKVGRTPDVKGHVVRGKIRRDPVRRQVFIDSHMLCGGMLGGL